MPESWQKFIKKTTGYKIEDLVSSEPRGKVLHNKIRKIILQTDLKKPDDRSKVEFLQEQLPSFGGDWEQYYEVEIPFE